MAIGAQAQDSLKTYMMAALRENPEVKARWHAYEAAMEAATSADDGKVNINTADAKTLMTLPGIGESKANSIIKYRESKGNFNSIEDIKNISGIKDGVYNKIADSIKV